MRKYQQLCLVLISVISVTVLFMYRSENSRLKYVLEVVNFFGRNDATALIRLENSTKLTAFDHDFASPLPVWTRISSGIHAYSAFWNNNLLAAGGEVVILAVGFRRAIVSFKCDLEYADAKTQRGKFGFIREEVVGGLPAADEKSIPSNDESYIIYKLLCKVSRDFGTPLNVIFTDTTAKIRHSINVRPTINERSNNKQLVATCLDLTPDNQTTIWSETNLLEYFYHHHVIGVEEFLVYDTNNVMGTVKQKLFKSGIIANVLPYNFPFGSGNSLKKRRILEIDCLSRIGNSAKYAYLTQPNTFLYPDTNLKSPTAFLKDLPRNNSHEESRFEISINTICTNPTNKLLSANLLPGKTNNTPFILYKLGSKADNPKALPLKTNKLLVHRYTNDCDKLQTSVETAATWRAAITNSKLLEYYDVVCKEVVKLFV